MPIFKNHCKSSRFCFLSLPGPTLLLVLELGNLDVVKGRNQSYTKFQSDERAIAPHHYEDDRGIQPNQPTCIGATTLLVILPPASSLRPPSLPLYPHTLFELQICLVSNRISLCSSSPLTGQSIPFNIGHTTTPSNANLHISLTSSCRHKDITVNSNSHTLLSQHSKSRKAPYDS